MANALRYTNSAWTQAACAGPDQAEHHEQWFPEESDMDALRAAVRVCVSCPIRELCLQTALAEEAGTGRHSRWGVRGGMTARQRWNMANGFTVVRVRIEPKQDRNTKPLAPCGTDSAYDRHIRDREPADQACKDAHAAKKREQKERKKQRELDDARQSVAS